MFIRPYGRHSRRPVTQLRAFTSAEPQSFRCNTSWKINIGSIYVGFLVDILSSEGLRGDSTVFLIVSLLLLFFIAGGGS